MAGRVRSVEERLEEAQEMVDKLQLKKDIETLRQKLSGQRKAKAKRRGRR